MSTAQRTLTPEELERKAQQKGYELDGGKLVKRKLSTLSTTIGGIIYAMLFEFARRSGAGFPFSDNTVFRCFSDDSSRERKPDVSWFVKARIPKPIGDAKLTTAPDLIVEVISPREGAAETEKKVRQFFEAGTSEAWIVYPETKTIHRLFAEGRNGRIYNVDQDLDGSPLLPGFSFKLSDVLAIVPQ